ncbi:MAG: CRISPR-associated protein Cas8c [Candidatus Tokpelaia hoelldobleri]|uniref:CRISPR-associated protein Cas8c n=1 Tax=Candidatus Tokpelaia hoelldobleri TaxID=1902579 RepID=A0A1U9JTW1_9HYPH|nr:MAG: CRISPR-associated protein Cas8c [Candidatus Tokpelaia hoelldoblerii]
MTILSSLVRAYERIPNVPPSGFTREKIGAVLVLNPDGSVVRIDDLRDVSKKKALSASIDVPKPVKRTAGIAPNFLWDKTSYTLGITAGEGKRTAEEHAAFVDYHEKLLAGSDDEGLKVFLSFLRRWNGNLSGIACWNDDLLDSNIIFVLKNDWEDKQWLHLRPAARNLWANLANDDSVPQGVCLITGHHAPVARLHPAIKGVFGAQSAGAALSSFNKDSFTSYGHEQGNNAPVSVYAADAYTTALNLMLARGSGNHMLIGDTTVVFWAEAEDAAVARRAEQAFDAIWGGSVDKEEIADNLERETSQKISTLLDSIRKGKQLHDIDPALEKDVRFFVLGLAPNAARLVVRFFYEDSFGHIVRNYQKFIEEMRVEPGWKTPYPPFFLYLSTMATLGKRENLPPRLAAEWMQSIISGGRYPATLLSTMLMRIRLDSHVNALRASILKAMLIRNFHATKEATVMLNTECRNTGYLLGRLFAVYEQMQSAALGPNVNATVKDKFYASASVQPRKVFNILERNSANHLAKLRKTKGGYAVNLEKLVREIMGPMNPDGDPFPISLSPKEQGLFGLAYHQQKGEFFKPKSENIETVDTETTEEK